MGQLGVDSGLKAPVLTPASPPSPPTDFHRGRFGLAVGRGLRARNVRKADGRPVRREAYLP